MLEVKKKMPRYYDVLAYSQYSNQNKVINNNNNFNNNINTPYLDNIRPQITQSVDYLKKNNGNIINNLPNTYHYLARQKTDSFGNYNNQLNIQNKNLSLNFNNLCSNQSTPQYNFNNIDESYNSSGSYDYIDDYDSYDSNDDNYYDNQYINYQNNVYTNDQNEEYINYQDSMYLSNQFNQYENTNIPNNQFNNYSQLNDNNQYNYNIQPNDNIQPTDNINECKDNKIVNSNSSNISDNTNTDDDDDESEEDIIKESYISEDNKYVFAPFRINKIDKPIRMLFAGPSGCGKTHFLMNFIKEFKHNIDFAYGFAGSRTAYEQLCTFIDPRYVFFVEQDLKEIPTKKFGSTIVEHNDKYHAIINWIYYIAQEIMYLNALAAKLDPRYKTRPKYKTLFIFDDLNAALDIKEFTHPIFNKLFKQGRHDGFTITLLVQKMSDCNTNMRSSITHFVPYLPIYDGELGQMASVAGIPDKVLRELLISFKEKLSVIIIDKEKPSSSGWIKSCYAYKPCSANEIGQVSICHPFQTLLGNCFKKKEEDIDDDFDESNINLLIYHKGKQIKKPEKKDKKKSKLPPEKQDVSKSNNIIFG